ncbi:cellulose biosynthesis cyclic di-GMP-binding regulatory protein BcsB [Salinimonas sp. HHU 13199]|uniref:Cyclic di-GMP-binding protein n=1 Tax=Salinimonas profundi TaxID=2729140 RepID=A0ABR8LSM9_9ALTE|nr:cellulose biosynthesis cyclic di-GMP-binding regulatory protein BcsB [Salinimonas profundi]MBD3586959.1 cellulose biosynthesis cyclic di-GMP-binding regulatory protein BcsB [Salinimonas profundi]
MKTILTGALVALLLAFTAHAQQTSEARLSSFYPGDSTLRLQGKQATATLSVPLAAGQTVQSATISIDAVNSKALIKSRSILNVRFNNATIGQIHLDPERPAINSQVNIPASLWRAGFNNLTFAVSQHYANQCVDGGAPELWSEINLYNSMLSVKTESAQTVPVLQDLSGYFSPGIGAQQTVTLVTVEDDDKDVFTHSLPGVAQALALRNQYKPLSVSYQQADKQVSFPDLSENEQWNDALKQRYRESSWYISDAKPHQLHVLIGTNTALEPFLSKALYQRISGPFIAMDQTPAVNSGQSTIVAKATRLIVTGETAEQVRQAALTLGVMDDALNPGAALAMRVNDSSLVTVSDRSLRPGQEYTFAQIGHSDIVMRGEDSFSQPLTFYLPADFYVPENASVSLNLDFGYGAAFGPGSMMNILVNGELVHGLTLANPNGEFFRNYELEIPARHLRGGINRIDFDVVMRAPVTGQACDDISGSHLIFQLRNSSAIALPEAGQVATQPDLALFRDTAFPFARGDNTMPVSIYVNDKGMTGAALTLAAKLAQVAGVPLPAISIEQGLQENLTDNAIILSTPDALPERFATDYSTSLTATKRWPYRLQNELHNRIRKVADDKNHAPLLTKGATTQQSGLENMAVLIAEKNPAAENTGNVYIIATQTPELMAARINELVSLSLWGQLAGDFFSWQDAQEPLLAMQVAEQFEIGEAGNSWLSLRMWLSNNPWYWLVVVALIVIISTFIAVLLLRRRNKAMTEQW